MRLLTSSSMHASPPSHVIWEISWYVLIRRQAGRDVSLLSESFTCH